MRPDRRDFLQSGISALRVWAAYAAIETITFTILPWALVSRERYSGTYPLTTLAAMILLPIVGALVCPVAALFLARVDRWRDSSAGTDVVALCMLAILFTLNANSSSRVRGLPLFYLVAVDLLLAMYAVRALRRRPAAVALVIAGAPLLALSLLVPLWMAFDLGLSEVIMIVITLAILILVALLLTAIERRFGEMEQQRVARISSICVIVLWSIALLGGLSLRWHPPRFEVRKRKLESSAPNIVLITMDTVRADHLPMYGYGRNTAPKLMQLARRWTLFEHSYSSSDITISSHGSILTGQYVGVHGAHPAPRVGRANLFAAPLKAGIPTLAEMLAHLGYRTCGVVANGGYLSRRFGFSRGFDYYDDRNPPPCAGANPFALRSRIAKYTCSGSDDDTGYRRAPEINRIVVPLVDAARRDGAPLFLFVNYMDAHAPYRPQPPFDRLFSGIVHEDVQVVTDRWWERAKRGDPAPTSSEREQVISQYDGGITTVDDAIGTLVSEIDRKLGPNTEIIITSDHGEAFGEHHLIGHSDGVYQELTRVPLLIRFPFQQHRIVRTAAVSAIDIVPTVLRAAGVAPPSKLPGVDLSAGEAPADRVVFAVSFPIETWIGVSPLFNRRERVAILGDHAVITSTRGKKEAYDLKEDAGELVNIFGRDATLDSRLASLSPVSPNRRRPELRDGFGRPEPTRIEPREASDKIEAPFLESVPYLRSLPYLQ